MSTALLLMRSKTSWHEMLSRGLNISPSISIFFQDVRIRKLIKRQSGKAVTVYTLLLCLIYEKMGTTCGGIIELPFICSELSGFGEAFISEVINSCLALGLFSQELYDSNHILTSKGIQMRYCTIQRLTKRRRPIKEFSLITATAEKDVAEDNIPSQPPNPPTDESSQAELQPTYQQYTVADSNNQSWLKEFFADNHHESLMLLCKNFDLPFGDIQQLKSLAYAVVSEWELSNTTHYNYSDWSRHLISTMRIKNRETKLNPKTSNEQQPPSDYTYNGGFGGVDV